MRPTLIILCLFLFGCNNSSPCHCCGVTDGGKKIYLSGDTARFITPSELDSVLEERITKVSSSDSELVIEMLGQVMRSLDSVDSLNKTQTEFMMFLHNRITTLEKK